MSFFLYKYIPITTRSNFTHHCGRLSSSYKSLLASLFWFFNAFSLVFTFAFLHSQASVCNLRSCGGGSSGNSCRLESDTQSCLRHCWQHLRCNFCTTLTQTHKVPTVQAGRGLTHTHSLSHTQTNARTHTNT